MKSMANKRLWFLFAFGGLLTLVLAACGTSTNAVPTPSPSPEPTSAPIPAVTSLVTETPIVALAHPKPALDKVLSDLHAVADRGDTILVFPLTDGNGYRLVTQSEHGQFKIHLYAGLLEDDVFLSSNSDPMTGDTSGIYNEVITTNGHREVTRRLLVGPGGADYHGHEIMVRWIGAMVSEENLPFGSK